jgi:hypothetical protein
MEIIINGCSSLEERFSQIDAHMVQEEMANAAKNNDKILPAIKKMISDDEIEYVCTQCADYHLCVRCFRPTKMKHNCKIEEELLEIKRDISDNNYAEDKTGTYTIESVRYV